MKVPLPEAVEQENCESSLVEKMFVEVLDPIVNKTKGLKLHRETIPTATS